MWERRRASEGQVKGGRETEEESRRKMSGQRGVMSQRAGEDSKASKSIITARRHTASPFNNLIME